MNWLAILPDPDTSSLNSYVSTAYVIWISAFCTLAIYSYLFKENAVYRAVIQASIGLGIGYSVVVNWQEILYVQWWLPMTDSIRSLVTGTPGSKWGLLWILVGILGVLWYFQLSRRWIWLSRIVIGLTVGIGAGLTFKSQFGQNIPQLTDSFRPLTPAMVSPTPRLRFTLPSASVKPAIAEPVAYFASDKEVQCIELLRGKLVWKSELASKPKGALRISGDDLIVSCENAVVTLDRNTGKEKATGQVEKDVITHLDFGKDVVVTPQSIGDWKLDGKVSDACLIKGLTTPERGDYDELVAVVDGVPQALDKDGKVIWKADEKATAQKVFDGGRVLFAIQDKTVRVLDPITGKLMKNIELKDVQKLESPSIARMPEPSEDNIVGLFPSDTTKIRGVMAVNDKKTARNAGESLWTYDTKKPINWVTSLDGVMVAVGPNGGGCYEIPRPTAKQKVSDFTDNWVFVVALLSIMVYFFFSFKQRTAKGVAQFSNLGRWTLMIGFGAIFGNTIMTRMSFLLERLMFLTEKWLFPIFDLIRHLFER